MGSFPGCNHDIACHQTHPNVDKKLFLATSQVGLKNPDKPFPLNQEVGVLKWRLQTQDEALIPLSSEWCWVRGCLGAGRVCEIVCLRMCMGEGEWGEVCIVRFSEAGLHE